MASPFSQKLAESLGLKADATKADIIETVERLLGSREDESRTLREPDDPRDAMHEHACAEVDKARAAGQEIPFTEGLARARKAHPKLDKELAEGYASNRWTR